MTMFLSKRAYWTIASDSTEQVLTEFSDAMREAGFGTVLDQFRGEKGRFISLAKIDDNPEAFRKSLERLVGRILDEFATRQSGSQKGVFKENVKESFLSLLQDSRLRPLLGQEFIAVLGFIVAALASKSGKGSESNMARMLKMLHKQVPTALARFPASFYSKFLTELYDPQSVNQMKSEWFGILPKNYHDAILKETQSVWEKRTKR